MGAPAATDLAMQQDAVAVLSRHGRSFHFASRFLGRSTAAAGARLYSFCRWIDDIADGHEEALDRAHALSAMRRDLARGTPSCPRVADFLALCARNCTDRAPAIALIDAASSDLGKVAVPNQSALLRYSYGIAGTVGLIMADLLGTTDPRARYHAIDLGIAMQLTNIARDVAEDARSGRRYIPATLVGDLDPSDVAAAPEALRPRLRDAVRSILDLAERYYESGEDGIAYLPARVRPAILIAARVYRAIGRRIASRGYATWRGRAYVNTLSKAAIALRALFDLCISRRYRQPCGFHDASLHAALQGLPGAHIHAEARR